MVLEATKLDITLYMERRFPFVLSNTFLKSGHFSKKWLVFVNIFVALSVVFFFFCLFFSPQWLELPLPCFQPHYGLQLQQTFGFYVAGNLCPFD